MHNFMTHDETVAWIFLSTALATRTEPTNMSGISMVADGINHAVPTQKEFQTSFSFLTRKGLVEKKGKNYSLTVDGKKEFDEASQNTEILLEIWQNLEEKIKNYA